MSSGSAPGERFSRSVLRYTRRSSRYEGWRRGLQWDGVRSIRRTNLAFLAINRRQALDRDLFERIVFVREDHQRVVADDILFGLLPIRSVDLGDLAGFHLAAAIYYVRSAVDERRHAGPGAAARCLDRDLRLDRGVLLRIKRSKTGNYRSCGFFLNTMIRQRKAAVGFSRAPRHYHRCRDQCE